MQHKHTYIAVTVALVSAGILFWPMLGKLVNISALNLRNLVPAQVGTSPALNVEVPIVVQDSEEIGTYFTDPTGHTLYVTTLDTCTGTCLDRWPAYYAEHEYQNGSFGTVLREDNGLWQYTWNGFPLYFYADDLEINDAKGDGFKQVWFVARP